MQLFERTSWHLGLQVPTVCHMLTIACLYSPTLPLLLKSKTACCGAGALFKACVDGDAAYVELLINNGMSASTSDYNQRTPLHLAASNGHTHIVHFLCNQAVCFLTLPVTVSMFALCKAART